MAGDKQIVRYELPLTGSDGSAEQVLEFPEGSKVLECREQYGRHPCLWVLEPLPVAGQPEPAKQRHKFNLFGTGVRIPEGKEDFEYVGSGQVSGGDKVVHVFEDVGPDANCTPVSEPVHPGNGSGNDVDNPPAPGPERGGQDSTPGNSDPSAPPPGTPPAAPAPGEPPAEQPPRQPALPPEPCPPEPDPEPVPEPTPEPAKRIFW